MMLRSPILKLLMGIVICMGLTGEGLADTATYTYDNLHRLQSVQYLSVTAPITTASPVAGTYASYQDVTLTCTDGAGSACDKIYYTLDGTVPTNASSVYSAPITITTTSTLKYFGVDKSTNTESVETGGYTIDTSLAQYRIGTTSSACGIVSPQGDVGVIQGTNQTFTIQPNSNAKLADLLVDGVSVGAQRSYRFDNVMANHSLEARFLIPDGDLNQDGVVDSADATLALQIAVGLQQPTPSQLLHGDVAPYVDGQLTPDGVINVADALGISWKTYGGTWSSDCGKYLSVVRNGNGSGTVSSGTRGLSCGSACRAGYATGASVELYAVPDANSTFAGWTGGGCSGTGICATKLNSDTTVNATFTIKPPTSAFLATPTSGSWPLTVNFTDQSLRSFFWLWSFGDGTTATIKNPTHVYQAPGLYTVTLTTSNASGSQTTTKNNYLNVGSMVSFNSNGGSAVGSQSAAYHSATSAPTAPTKTGYIFAGWYTNSELTAAFNFATPITANTMLYAKWTANNYTVSFDSHGGSAVTSQIIPFNSLAVAPTAPTKAACTFTGWYTDNGMTVPFNFATAITADTILYAKWLVPVTFIAAANGSLTGAVNQSVSYGGSTTAVTAVPATCYRFVNWTGCDFVTTTSNPVIVTNVTSACSLNATFSHFGPIKNNRTNITYFTIQEAYNAAALTGDILLLQAQFYTELLSAYLPKAVTIDGGYSCDFSNNANAISTIVAPHISNGSVKLKNIRIPN